MNLTLRSPSRRAMLAVWLALSAVLALAAPPARASSWYVSASAVCSGSENGTLASPYCSINEALSQHHTPGTRIVVGPGVYRETVVVPASGDVGQPIVLEGAPGAVLDGADDLSDADRWQPVNGLVWLAVSVRTAPSQVFVDSVRLAPWSGPPDQLAPGSFEFVLGQGLYVNIGGDNPGLHEVLVGSRLYGFQLTHRSWVTIRGFTILRPDLKGVYITQRSQHIEVAGNDIRWAHRYGIQADTCSAIEIRGNRIRDGGDHGIVLTRTTFGSRIEDNESSGHRHPLMRRANGVYLYHSPDNVVARNRLHHNQDTGVQIQSGSDRVLCVQNLSWSNGDHGFDNLSASGNRYVGDVSYGNWKDGFSFEGGSTDNAIHDCIASENGTRTNEFDLWLDESSRPGFESDHNLFWSAGGKPNIKVGARAFDRLSDYSNYTGLDLNSIQDDPKFVDPAAGDLRLMAGSPAIDVADASAAGWPELDARGSARIDDPRTANRGLGVVTYADLGALEFDPGSSIASAPVTRPTTTSDALGTGLTPESGPLGVHPNPVRDGASLRFRLGQPDRVRLMVCDAGGRIVREVLDAPELAVGEHQVTWDGRDARGARLPAGMYYLVLRSAAGSTAGAFALVR